MSIGILGFVTGYFVADDADQMAALQLELQRATSARRPGPSRKPGPFTSARATGSVPHNERDPTDAAKQAQSEGASDLLSRAKVTQEDLDVTAELTRRSEQGEFILKSELPMFKKVETYDLKAIASQRSSNNAAEYKRVFGNLGLEAEVCEQLHTHLRKIHVASLEAETAITQLLDARQKYDTRLRTMLSAEDYDGYRRYEELKPAADELGRLQKAAAESRDFVWDPQYDSLLLGLIADAGLAGGGDWHGPYDPLPQVRLGADDVLAWAREQVEHTTSGTELILKQADGSGVPREYQDLLEEYYRKLCEQKQTLVECIRVTKAV